jgi:hypothetical protein
MSTTPPIRKRKRSLNADESDSLFIDLSSLADTQPGPVLGEYSYFLRTSASIIPWFVTTQQASLLLRPQKTSRLMSS